MNLNLSELKALATAAKRDPYDHVAGNDYGMAMPPAVTLELIAEIERHRLVNAEGCKPESCILLSGAPCADAAPRRNLDEAEGCKPDHNSAIHSDDMAAITKWHSEFLRLTEYSWPDDASALQDQAYALGRSRGVAESIAAIKVLQAQLTEIKAVARDVLSARDADDVQHGHPGHQHAERGRWDSSGAPCRECAAYDQLTLLSASADRSPGLADTLPTVAVEGDQLVIRITTECLLHAITCAPEWPVDYRGDPISIQNDTLLIQEIIHELQREDEQGTNQMHRLFDQAALDAINNGSEAVSYD
ncbi:hypothetical protein [Pseudomonas mosselii]|uniref:Uncharacterized protein n=1 Tax=Pseudomonas mosselii TaxID=78327 RepID=A0A7W2JV02_9PSED|nr:hypothetical protein [Pseudomonas mosselii]MBA6065679.1 hypothetical protein [Pseudomonas mosselii]